MKKNQPTDIQTLRTKHNLDLIRRMREGDSLKSFDSRASWFPPRPVIEKDSQALSQLYGSRSTRVKASTVPVEVDGQVATIVALSAQGDLSQSSMDDGRGD